MSDLAVIEGEIVDAPETLAPATLFRTEDPREVVTRASETATVLSDVIRKQNLFKTIGKKDHILVEGWTLLGSMLGVFAVCEWTRKLENGWEARVIATTRDGATVGAAEAECLRSESLWANRDDYAIRSMAQTRATSKALRQPLGFIVTLAGFSPTPAEEMPQGPGAGHVGAGRENPEASRPVDEVGSTLAPDLNPAREAYIKALVSDAAKLRRTTQKAVREALTNDGYILDSLSPEQAEEVVGKLERWVKALKAAS